MSKVKGQAPSPRRSHLAERRARSERRFRAIGMTGVVLALAAVSFLLVTIFSSGYSAFWRTEIALTIEFDPKLMKVESDATFDQLQQVNYLALFRKNLERALP